MARPAMLLGAACLAAVAAARVAAAQTPAETADKWGLLGTWRLDCSQKPSRGDPDLQFAVRGGTLFHDRDWGVAKDSSAVTSALIEPDGSLELVVRFDSLSQTREWIYKRGSDNRIESVSNRNVDTNKYTIRDGKFVASGKTPPWQTRCR